MAYGLAVHAATTSTLPVWGGPRVCMYVGRAPPHTHASKRIKQSSPISACPPSDCGTSSAGPPPHAYQAVKPRSGLTRGLRVRLGAPRCDATHLKAASGRLSVPHPLGLASLRAGRWPPSASRDLGGIPCPPPRLPPDCSPAGSPPPRLPGRRASRRPQRVSRRQRCGDCEGFSCWCGGGSGRCVQGLKLARRNVRTG